MARRSRRNTRRNAVRNNVFKMRYPSIAYIDEGKAVNISFEKLIGTNLDVFNGIPWRLKSAYFETTKINNIDDPALFQVSLNSATGENVLSVTSARWLVTPGVTKSRVLRMKNPNPWKEDEDRHQALITLSNISTGSSTLTARVFCYFIAEIQFGQIPFNIPSTVTVHHSSPHDEDQNSLPSSMSRLSISSQEIAQV